jgi:NADPH:quinone reductase-like Zn-dependent oxidoreductase
MIGMKLSPSTDRIAAQPGDQMTVWTTRGDGIGQLRAETAVVPRPERGQILVRIAAVALNYRDLLVINGVGGWNPETSVVPISDGVGQVVASGVGVTRFQLGDRVSGAFLPQWHSGPLTRENYTLPIGGPRNRGLLAQYVVFDESEAVRMPPQFSDHQAATLPVAGVTAWHAVARRCQVRPGDSVLIHGTGGVSLFALQFTVALGGTAIITSSSDTKLEKARNLGAAGTINYLDTPDLAAEVLRRSGGHGVDHVIETVGGTNLNQSLDAVKIGGTIGFIGLLGGLSAAVDTYRFVTRNVTLHGLETGSREMLEEMIRFVAENELESLVDSVFPVSHIHDALRYLERGEHFGKIVVTL